MDCSQPIILRSDESHNYIKKIPNIILPNTEKKTIALHEISFKEISYEWPHRRILSTDVKVIATLLKRKGFYRAVCLINESINFTDV